MGIRSGPGTNLRQAGIFLDLQTPSGIINQMKLQFVQLIHGHHVNVFLHKLLIKEIACHIEHHSSPGTFRRIKDRHSRNSPVYSFLTLVAINLSREQLKQGLYAIKDSALVGSVQYNATGLYIQLIAFGLALCLVRRQSQTDIALILSFHQTEVPSCGLTQNLL